MARRRSRPAQLRGQIRMFSFGSTEPKQLRAFRLFATSTGKGGGITRKRRKSHTGSRPARARKRFLP